MAHVSSITQAVCEFTGGLDHFEVEADTVRALLAAIEQRFPGLGKFASEQMAIAIDGVLYQEALGEHLRPDSEVVLIPKISGG
jgi:sulfur-carrier protein